MLCMDLLTPGSIRNGLEFCPPTFSLTFFFIATLVCDLLALGLSDESSCQLGVLTLSLAFVLLPFLMR